MLAGVACSRSQPPSCQVCMWSELWGALRAKQHRDGCVRAVVDKQYGHFSTNQHRQMSPDLGVCNLTQIVNMLRLRQATVLGCETLTLKLCALNLREQTAWRKITLGRSETANRACPARTRFIAYRCVGTGSSSAVIQFGARKAPPSNHQAPMLGRSTLSPAWILPDLQSAFCAVNLHRGGFLPRHRPAAWA